jgi:hypothetical protein
MAGVMSLKIMDFCQNDMMVVKGGYRYFSL